MKVAICILISIKHQGVGTAPSTNNLGKILVVAVLLCARLSLCCS